MSKKKKRTGGNPAKRAAKEKAERPLLKRRCAYCGRSTRVQPDQVSEESARLPHHPVRDQEWVPMCEEGRKMRAILHRQRQEAA